MRSINVRIAIWLFFVVVSVLLIGPNFNPVGLVVDSASNTTAISAGDIIYEIDGKIATVDDLEKDYYGSVTLDTNKGKKIMMANGSLGISAEPVSMTNLIFGLDIKGGTRAIVKPDSTENNTIDRIISTLQTRINVYGLRDSSFRPLMYKDQGYIEITMAGGTQKELKELLERQGKFEAHIPLRIELANNTGTINLDKEYKMIVNEKLSIPSAGIEAGVGEEFTLAGIPFIVNSLDEVVNITSIVYTGDDIVSVFLSGQTAKEGGYYRWEFPVQISMHGAEKFAWITQNVPRRLEHLESKIYLYLDNNLIDSLNIAAGLKGKAETNILVTGGSDTQEEAIEERTRLQSILRSGALPAGIEVVQLEDISPNLGTGFVKNAIIAGLAAVLGVSIVVLLRYRNLLIVGPMIIVSLSEILIILGVSVLIKWTIDLAAIAGIIAAVGTGIDSQIIILDQTLRKEAREETLRERLSRAFFIIFGAGGVVIAAMLPLMTLGFGLLRGFAITTMIGVLAGILITRPAFGEIVRRIVKE